MDRWLQSAQNTGGQLAVVSAEGRRTVGQSSAVLTCWGTDKHWLRAEVHSLSAAFGSFGPGPCVECSGDICPLPPCEGFLICGSKLEMHAHLNSFTKKLAMELSVVKCQMRATDCNCFRVQTASRTGRRDHRELATSVSGCSRKAGSRCCPQL